MADLYVMHHSTCARKALFVMLEKGLFDRGGALVSREVERDFLRSPAYRRLNPDGLVPTLVVGGDGEGDQVLVESSVIMRFIDEAYVPSTLQPIDPLERAHMNLWMKLVDEKYFPSLQAITVAVFMRRMFGVPPDEARLAVMLDSLTDHGLRLMRESAIRQGPASPYVAHGLAQLRAMLDRMELSLGRHAFLAGESLSLADCAMTPLVLRLVEFGLDAAFRDGRPNVTAWWDSIAARPTVQRLVALADQALLHELTSSIGDARSAYLEALRPAALPA